MHYGTALLTVPGHVSTDNNSCRARKTFTKLTVGLARLPPARARVRSELTVEVCALTDRRRETIDFSG